MKSKLTFIYFATVLFLVACQNEENLLIESINSGTTTESIKSFKGINFQIKNDRIVFDSSNDYASMYDSLSNATMSDLKKWQDIITIKTLKQKYDEDTINLAQGEQDYAPENIVNDHAKGMLPYLFNEKGEMQYGDTILVIKKEKLFYVYNNEDILSAIQSGLDNFPRSEAATSRHYYTINPAYGNIANIKVPQRVTENSNMIYYSDRIRKFVEYKGTVVELSNDKYRFEFRMTSYSQNRLFMIWWAPQENVFIKRASIVCQGFIGQNPVYYNSGIHYFDNESIGVHIADQYEYKQILDLNVTYMFVHNVKGPEETVTKTITYRGVSF